MLRVGIHPMHFIGTGCSISARVSDFSIVLLLRQQLAGLHAPYVERQTLPGRSGAAS